MPVPIYHVDAFTDRAFAGNPAAVCVLDGETDTNWMQQIAAAMNLSESAFCWRSGQGWLLRWFTPAAEVELCGHGTLAAAHVLWEQNLAPPDQTIAFVTRFRGVLGCSRDNSG